ncbi:MAG: coproporphyrinogen III oxidase, partial [Armatimonadota bacterium]
MVDLGIGQREGMAIYVHVPFCPSKCGYCDFNSYAVGQLASGEGIVDRTVQAIIAEIRGSRLAGVPAKTIFF